MSKMCSEEYIRIQYLGYRVVNGNKCLMLRDTDNDELLVFGLEKYKSMDELIKTIGDKMTKIQELQEQTRRLLSFNSVGIRLDEIEKLLKNVIDYLEGKED